MRIIGLTGSIGMGKSTTRSCSRSRAFRSTTPMRRCMQFMRAKPCRWSRLPFPAQPPTARSTGRNSRPRCCGDPEALKKLEQIVHPMLGAHRQKFLDDAEKAGAPVVVMDVPLLFETGGEKRVDAVVVVSRRRKSSARACWRAKT